MSFGPLCPPGLKRGADDVTRATRWPTVGSRPAGPRDSRAGAI